jgi:hypothetical protein
MPRGRSIPLNPEALISYETFWAGSVVYAEDVFGLLSDLGWDVFLAFDLGLGSRCIYGLITREVSMLRMKEVFRTVMREIARDSFSRNHFIYQQDHVTCLERCRIRHSKRRSGDMPSIFETLVYCWEASNCRV